MSNFTNLVGGITIVPHNTKFPNNYTHIYALRTALNISLIQVSIATYAPHQRQIRTIEIKDDILINSNVNRIFAHESASRHFCAMRPFNFDKINPPKK